MRLVSLIILVTVGTLRSWLVHACSGPAVETAFDTDAPMATDIVAVQVQSLALDPDATRHDHTFRGKIRILKHYRGSREFEEIQYRNDHCWGLHLDVGGIYLIATSSLTSTIELSSYRAPILHLSGFFTFDPGLVLRLSSVVKQLEAAVRGEGTFAITTTETRQEMSIFDRPPRVPRPEDIQNH